jgi:CubicO group peptidase (beta-lactamase class C family)
MEIRTRQARSLAFLLAFLFASPARAEPPKGFGEWLEVEMARSGVPGVSIAVMRDFGVEWAAGYGLADIGRAIPMTTGVLFQAASVSKPVTALAVMIALKRHALSVEEDIDAILNRFPPLGPTQNWRLPNPYRAKVRVSGLLSHTGGTNAFTIPVTATPTTRRRQDRSTRSPHSPTSFSDDRLRTLLGSPLIVRLAKPGSIHRRATRSCRQC